MRRVSFASWLAVSALLCAAVVPACSGAAGQPGFGNPNGNGGSNGNGGNGNGGNGNNGNGGNGNGGNGNGSTAPGLGGNVGSNDAGSSTNASDAGCATATATATAKPQPVSMLFILDGSGSMNQDNKWTAVTAALTNIFNDMASKNDPGLFAGINVFSDQNDPTGGLGPYPSTPDVPIAQVNTAQATALEARFNPSQPGGGTPTGTALQGSYAELEAFSGGGANAKKVVILLTDGVPSGFDQCATTSNASNPCMTMAAGELAKAAPAGPIETFAIGVGVYPSTSPKNFDPAFLGYLAQAGGSGPASCNPAENAAGATDLCYFEVDPSGSSTATQTAFENAINAIRGQVVTLSCTFALDLKSDAGAIDPSKVNVTVNGTTVPQDPKNGWTYDNPNNPTSVTLHGTSCAEVTSTQTATVSIVLGCATVVPPPAK
jgi:hypothetical protein